MDKTIESMIERNQKASTLILLLPFLTLIASALPSFGQAFPEWLSLSCSIEISRVLLSSTGGKAILLLSGTGIFALFLVPTFFAFRGKTIAYWIATALLLGDGVGLPFLFRGGDIVPLAISGIVHLVCIALQIAAGIRCHRLSKALS